MEDEITVSEGYCMLFGDPRISYNANICGFGLSKSSLHESASANKDFIQLNIIVPEIFNTRNLHRNQTSTHLALVASDEPSSKIGYSILI